jgi:hypothetical protein
MQSPSPFFARVAPAFAINDGVSYRGLSADGMECYETMFKDLNKALGTKMKIQYVNDYNSNWLIASSGVDGPHPCTPRHSRHQTGEYSLRLCPSPT